MPECITAIHPQQPEEIPDVNKFQARQGDVLIEKLSLRVPTTFRPLAESARQDVVLAYGEVTGHAHRMHRQMHRDGGSDAISYAHPLAPTEPALVNLLSPMALRHEEHGPIEIPRGVVRISRPYEYVAPDLIRRVED
jgi:hypothetical protein